MLICIRMKLDWNLNVIPSALHITDRSSESCVSTLFVKILEHVNSLHLKKASMDLADEAPPPNRCFPKRRALSSTRQRHSLTPLSDPSWSVIVASGCDTVLPGIPESHHVNCNNYRWRLPKLKDSLRVTLSSKSHPLDPTLQASAFIKRVIKRRNLLIFQLP